MNQRLNRWAMYFVLSPTSAIGAQQWFPGIGELNFNLHCGVFYEQD